MDSLNQFIPPALLPLVDHLRTQGPLLGVTLLSLAAAYLGYLYVLGRKEAAVTFNVPIPPEIRANWKGEKWDSLQGEGRKVLEGQVRGVRLPIPSPLQNIPASKYLDMLLTSFSCAAMERQPDHELLSRGRKSTRQWNQTRNS